MCLFVSTDKLTRPDTHCPILTSGNCAATIWESGNRVDEGCVTRKGADGRRFIEGVDVDVTRMTIGETHSVPDRKLTRHSHNSKTLVCLVSTPDLLPVQYGQCMSEEELSGLKQDPQNEV